MNVGELIRKFRERKGWTQYALAKRAGMSQQALAAIESSTSQKAMLETVRRLCAALDITVQELCDLLPTIELGDEAQPRGRPPKAEPEEKPKRKGKAK